MCGLSCPLPVAPYWCLLSSRLPYSDWGAVAWQRLTRTSLSATPAAVHLPIKVLRSTVGLTARYLVLLRDCVTSRQLQLRPAPVLLKVHSAEESRAMRMNC